MRLIARLRGDIVEPRVKHYRGLPPELTKGKDSREEMMLPVFLLLDEKPSEGVFLFRYDAQGNCVGDTWHQNVAEAKEQARFEYESVLSKWIEIPTEVQSIQQILEFGFRAFPRNDS